MLADKDKVQVQDRNWRFNFYTEAIEPCTTKQVFNGVLLKRRLENVEGILGQKITRKSLDRIEEAIKDTFGNYKDPKKRNYINVSFG